MTWLCRSREHIWAKAREDETEQQEQRTWQGVPHSDSKVTFKVANHMVNNKTKGQRTEQRVKGMHPQSTSHGVQLKGLGLFDKHL